MIIDLWHIALDLLIPINKGVTMVDVDVTHIWSQKLQPFILCVTVDARYEPGSVNVATRQPQLF